MPVQNDFYLARDFSAIKEVLIEYALQNFPEWTDLNESEQGMILIELYALVGDVLHRYIDRQADEFDVTKVSQRRNMMSLMKLISYRMAGAKAATATVDIETEDGTPVNNDVPVPYAFKIYTKDIRNPIVYEVLEQNARILKGQSKITLEVTQGETQDQYANFDGTAEQSLKLEMSPYIEGSVILEVGDETWEEVDNLLDSTSSDAHFYVETNENDEVTIRFGDGVAGRAPNGQAYITYRTGGGPDGMVGPNTLTLPESPQLMDVYGNPVSIKTNNAESSIGGDAKESIDEARVKGPNSLKANERTVGPEDFRNHPLEVPGVARALARFKKDVKEWTASTSINEGVIIRPSTENGHYYKALNAGTTGTTEPSWPTTTDGTVMDNDITWEEHGPSVLQNIARIHIVPDGGGLPQQALKDDVEDHLTNVKPAPTTMVIEPVDPLYVPIDVTATVVPKPGYTQADVATRTQTAIEEWLNDYTALNEDGKENLRWGMTVYPDDLAIKVEGCRSISITAPANPIKCAGDEIPSPGTVTVS